jgi:flagellar basal-body rod protein FlgC
MSSVLSIATSGLVAAQKRLDVSANNVANFESDGPLPPEWASATLNSTATGSASATQYPPAYKPQSVNQTALAGGGTATTVVDAQPSYTAGYDPNAPYASSNGLIARPNVSLVNEVLQQATASYTFALNVAMMRAYQRTSQSLLNVEA